MRNGHWMNNMASGRSEPNVLQSSLTEYRRTVNHKLFSHQQACEWLKDNTKWALVTKAGEDSLPPLKSTKTSSSNTYTSSFDPYKANVFNSNMSLSFQHPVHGYVMNIVDEAEVHQLRNVVFETKKIVHLYLEVFEGWVEQTEAADKIVPYNVENIVYDNVEGCPKEETVEVNTIEEEKFYELGRLDDKTLSDDEESNEVWADAIRVSTENVFPHAHHGVCAFHLLGNIVHRSSSIRPQVAAHLSEIPRAKWTRAYSSSKRYNYMTSISAESMNALSVDARKIPIIPLLEFIRRLFTGMV
ncbi:unnamed protein product [Lactuca saligna]|uniref:Uncharacterized protein n=1 Tax=Lactuca saligna TaxID=75948 RepID=A0AA36EQW2_LACSI|nr:unnamed protein product [Lactuca saligna]